MLGIRVRVERRAVTPTWLLAAASALSVASALLAISALFWWYGVDPLLAYRRIFAGAFGSTYGLLETLVKSIPLMLCGVGLTIAFRALVWNIGAEGQLLMGAIAATAIALFVPGIPKPLVLPLMFLSGFLAGAAWGVIPGVLKAKFRADEVVTTLMMNYIASELVNYLVYGPWKGPEEWGFPYSSKFPKYAWIPTIPGTRIHYVTLALALASAAAAYLLLMRTTIGYEIRVTGGNPDAARYAGMNYFRTVVLVMLLSGGLAGLAGVGEVAGIHHRLRYPSGISPGYGYTAIIVAWLGRLNPLAVILTSILFGGLLVGGDAIQVALGLPIAVVNVFNGAILLFVMGGDILTRYRIRVEWRRGR